MRVLYDPGGVVGALTGKGSGKTVIREPAPAPDNRDEEKAAAAAKAAAARESTLRRGRRQAVTSGGFGTPSSGLASRRTQLLGGGA